MAQSATQWGRQDPVRVDSEHYNIALEDDKIRVLRVKYGPHEESVMHGHPALVCIMLSDCHTRFTYPDGRTEEIKAKAGEIVSFPALDHLPENLSDRPMEVVVVELKS